MPQDALQYIRCVCGTDLSPAFVAQLMARPLRSAPCPNNVCRYVHRFVPPSTLRTMLLSAAVSDERDTPIRGPLPDGSPNPQR